MKFKIAILFYVIVFCSCKKEVMDSEWPWPWTIETTYIGAIEGKDKIQPATAFTLKNFTKDTLTNFKGKMTLRLKYIGIDKPRDIEMNVSIMSGHLPQLPGDTITVLGVSSEWLDKNDFKPIPDHMQIFYDYQTVVGNKTLKLETVKVVTPLWNQWRDRMLNQ